MAERWLVISHEATNSGAPKILLEVLRGVQAARTDWSCEILLGRGGTLYPDFARMGPVTVLAHPWAEGRTLRAGVYRKFLDRPWGQPRRLAAWMKRRAGSRFDLVYNNTATNGYLVSAARSFGCPILSHVHELGYSMRRFNTPAALRQTLENTDHFLAVSSAVATDLKACGAAADRITLTPNFLPVLPAQPTASGRAALREQLNLPADAYVIVGCGHIDWLKGTDVFVEMAATLSRLTPRPINVVWLGGESDRRFARQVRGLVRHLHLEGVVRFVGAVANAVPWFAASDLVTVTSRFESFSLVALEAAALGRPVVGFAAARGLTDLLGREPGLLLPNIDAEALASAVLAWLERPKDAAALGQRLRQTVAAEFLAVQRLPEITAITTKLVSRGRPAS